MKIGIFGGSFNPIHIGHAMLANYISQYTDVDKVWLMVSPENPLKGSCNLKDDSVRLRMAEMVSKGCKDVITSGFEYTLPRPSYTINTLNALSAKFPDDEFVIIIGADNWANFDKWKDNELIIQRYGVIVYPRNGYNIDDKNIVKNVTFLTKAPIIEISSSFIREGIKAGKNMNFFLPENVYDFVLRNSLYIENKTV
ncbi:MAG: nicotinate (nicotinamide) nucleotide adenylyltransferase [Muribaculaceae bacterium]